MHSTGFSYLVKNRLGIYYLQFRIPKHMMELNNSYVEQFKRLLADGNREDKVKFIQQLPRTFKNNIKDTLNLHFAGKKQTPTPPATPAPTPAKTIYSDEADPYLDIAYKRWVEEDADPAMKKSSFGEYARMIELFLRILKEMNKNIMPRVSEVDAEMIRHYKEIFIRH